MVPLRHRNRCLQRLSTGTLTLPVSPVKRLRFPPFATGDWYKATFTGSGMFRITGAELASSGFPVGVASSDEIRMYYGGGKTLPIDYSDLTTDNFSEIAITVNDGDDGTFDSSDSIIFYGEDISRLIWNPGDSRPEYQNHPYSAKNAVWITLSGVGTPKRIQSFGEPENTSIPLSTAYRYRKHLEQENIQELGNGSIIWYWLAVRNQAQSILFNAPGFVPGDTTHVRVSYLNIDNSTDYEKERLHSMSLFIQEREYPLFKVTALTEYFDFEYEGTLSSTGNIIQMRRKATDYADEVHLDWIDIDYLRELRFEDNALEFFREGNGDPFRLAVANVPGMAVRIFDTSDPYNVKRHSNPTYDSVSKNLRFQATLPAGESARYTLWNESSYLHVDPVVRKTSAVLRAASQGPNYIIISHPRFLTEARRLADWRKQDSPIESLTPFVVNVNDIYDAFGWGVMDPTAIRNYLQYVWENGNPDRNYYCLMFGDTINKYKNLSGNQADQNFVPTYATYESRGPLITDDFFTWVTASRTPVFAIGRLNVGDGETARIVVDKIINYESDPEPGQWHNRVFLVADDEYAGGYNETWHTKDLEIIDVGDDDNKFLPDTLEREKLLMIEYPFKNSEKPEATDAFIRVFNEGFITGTYIGHGNKGLLAHEHLFVGDRDMEKLNNDSRLPVFGLFSCTTADFVQPDNISLAEKLLLHESGGCVGVVAATGATYSEDNFKLGSKFFSNLFDIDTNPEMRVGIALKQAKIINGTNSNSQHYLILGDPATRLMAPRYKIATAPMDSIALLQKLEITGSITNGATPASLGSSKLYVKAHGPRIERSYTSHDNTVTYTMPGTVFYNGEIDLSGDDFDVSMVVPKDLGTGGDNTVIRLFDTTGNPSVPEAAGIISSFRIAGLDKDAPDDITGPEISLSFDGKQFEDGDFISRQPILKASFSDPSGINIIGQRGHNIMLTIDDTETTILTDHYRAINGYTSGVIEYDGLPVLSPGEHTFELSVYDAYNNASRKRVQAFVVGSETGDVAISDLLNWPNPMGYNGTSFTFNLTDDARSAEIKIYSQAGRMVDSMRFAAGYGFNQHFWTPPFTLANGVYFYKLTVQSVNGRKTSKIEKLVVMK